jgi:hypothetical protein
LLAHFALQKLHILPDQLAGMTVREKAFIAASCEMRVEAEKRAAKGAKNRWQN